MDEFPHSLMITIVRKSHNHKKTKHIQTTLDIQRSAKVFVRGLVIFVPGSQDSFI